MILGRRWSPCLMQVLSAFWPARFIERMGDTDFIKRMRLNPTVSFGSINLISTLCVLGTIIGFGFKEHYRIETLEARMSRNERILEDITATQRLAGETIREIQKNQAVFSIMFDTHVKALRSPKASEP